MERSGHRLLSLLGACLLMKADNLGRARRIDGADLAFGFDSFAADDEVMLAAQLVRDRVQRSLHGMCYFRRFEVGKGFVRKPALRRARLN